MYCIFLLDNIQYIEYTMIKVTTDCNTQQKGANDNEELVQRARIFERTIHRYFMRACLLLFKVIEDRKLDTKS